MIMRRISLQTTRCCARSTTASRRYFFGSDNDNLLSVTGKVGTITLDNGPANVMTFDYVRDLRAALMRAEENPELEALVFTAQSKGIFCAGLELDEVSQKDDLTCCECTA